MDAKEFDELLSSPLPEGQYAVVVGTIEDLMEASKLDDEEAAQHSVQLTAFRYGLAVSIFINVILLAVVAFTIGGN